MSQEKIRKGLAQCCLKRLARRSTNHHMAQSASELKENKNSRGRNKSTSNQMEKSKIDLLDLDPIEVLDWEVEKLEAGLKELGITIGVSWSKSRKAHELNKALEKIKIDNQENQAPMDCIAMML